MCGNRRCRRDGDRRGIPENRAPDVRDKPCLLLGGQDGTEPQLAPVAAATPSPYAKVIEVSKRVRWEIERDLIQFAIDHYSGHMSEVARRLGIGRSTLYRKVREYDLKVREGEDLDEVG